MAKGFYETYEQGFILIETHNTRLNITVKFIRFYASPIGGNCYAVVIYKGDKIAKEKDYKTYKGARDCYKKLAAELLIKT